MTPTTQAVAAAGGGEAVEAAQVRVRLEIEACAAVLAYVADVPDELSPDLFRFDDTRLIFTTAVYEGIPELPRRLRAAGFWREGPDTREPDDMRRAMDWSHDLLLEMCRWPRGNVRRCGKALIRHHRTIRDAMAHLARAGELIEAVTGAALSSRFNPYEEAVRLVGLARLSCIPVDVLANELNERNEKRRRVA